MKPDWDKLGSEYKDHSLVVIGDVDCTEHRDLCGEHDVQGFPTIKYFVGGEPEDYEGGRDFDDLKSFTEANLMSPPCDSLNKDKCAAEDLPKLEAAMALSADDRKQKIAEATARIQAANKAHEDLLETLQAQYEKSKEDTEKLATEIKQEMKWWKKVKEPTGKEEL